MFELYQAKFTENDSQLINTLGWDKACEVNVHVKAYFLSTRIKDYVGAWNTGAYSKVAEIDTTDLEHSFEIGNIGPEEKIKRVDSMRSMSVGDIVKDHNGLFYAVAPKGFEPLTIHTEEKLKLPLDPETFDLSTLLHIAETEAYNASEKYFKEKLGNRDQIPCGFTEVIILELNGKRIAGNTKLGKKFKFHGIEQNSNRKFSVWRPGGFNCQNIDALTMGARAFAHIFNVHGFKTYIVSRLD